MIASKRDDLFGYRGGDRGARREFGGKLAGGHQQLLLRQHAVDDPQSRNTDAG